MPYITKETLIERLGTERCANLCGGDNDEENATICVNAIARAEAIVNAFASARYDVPLEKTGIVEEWTLALCEYELYKRQPSGTIPEKIRESYRNTVAQLSDLAAGKIGTGGTLKAGKMNSIPVIKVMETENVFGHKSMTNY